MLWWRSAHVLGPGIQGNLLKGKSETDSLNMSCLAKPASCHSDYALNFMNLMFTWKEKKPVLVVIAHQYESPIISIKLINLFLKSIQNRSLKWV